MSDFHFDGFTAPEYTMVPDVVFDVLMPHLSEPELRVLLYIIRRTFGFKKSADDISLSQMVSGIRTHEGKVLDEGAGVARSSAAKAVNGLVDKGIIIATRNRSEKHGNEPTTYQLRWRNGHPSPLDGLGLSTTETSLVHHTDPQETVYKNTSKQRKKASGPHTSPEPFLRQGKFDGVVQR